MQYAVFHQPVTAAVFASPGGFQHYKGGVFTGDDCTGHEVDHAVTIVGYGSTGDGTSTAQQYGTSTAQQYWKLKNSWGAGWGESGYMRILRRPLTHGQGDDGICGINKQVSYPTVSPNTPSPDPEPEIPEPEPAPATPMPNATDCFVFYLDVRPNDAENQMITTISQVHITALAIVLVSVGVFFTFAGIQFIKVVLAIAGFGICGWAALQAAVVVLPT